MRAPPTIADFATVADGGASDPEKLSVEAAETVNAPAASRRVDPIDPALERRIVRKIDFRLIPLVTALYLLAYLDRSNIGNAKIAGMQSDLHLTGDSYQWLLTIFYISYILFEWCALMWKVVPPHAWAAFCVLGWGIAATAQAGATSWSGMMAARFFLGLFEAGYGPGIPFLLSFFYLRHEIGVRIGIFLIAAPLATCFAGALAYGITSGRPAIANWRVLFLVEGVPCLVMAVVTWFFLPDSTDRARFLSPEEKDLAKARGVRQVGADAETRIGHVSLGDVRAAVLDIKNYFTALMYFSCNVGFSSLPVFLPTIMTEMGFSDIDAQGLTSPPYFLSALIVLASTYIADRTQQRGLTIIVLSLIGATGYIMLASMAGTSPRYAGVFLAAAGIFPCIANILPWVLNNQGSDTRRGTGIAILNFVGQCGPLLGTRIYPTTDGPYYRMGMWVCAAFMIFNALLALTLRSILMFENRCLDQRFGKGQPQENVVGDENIGPGFRYVL